MPPQDSNKIAGVPTPAIGTDTIGATLTADSDSSADSVEILQRAQEVCDQYLAPNAQKADTGEYPLLNNLQALAEAGLMGIAIPARFGGLEASGVTQRRYTELLAASCGVTTFVQAQHHGASRMIANGPDETLKTALVPLLAAGKRFCAISFAHLRRPGPPVLSATLTEGGLVLNGIAPWVTGWGWMDQVVFGATLPDGRFVYVWTPAERSEYGGLFSDLPDRDLGRMEATLPIPLCTMNASATVELKLTDWYIPEAHILSYSDMEIMRRNDRNGVLGASAMPIGCATAGVALLRDAALKRGLPAVERAAASFSNELHSLKCDIEEWTTRTADPDFFTTAVSLRAWCIELALRTAHAAITAISGSANGLNHPAQRLIREAMFYTVQAQTREVMDATLARLER